MRNTRKIYTLALIALTSLFMFSAVASADPCLVVYPTTPAEYHYDVNEYYTVSFGHPLYDPFFDRGGQVLIDINTNEIALNIYQIPYLTGFKVSTNGEEGYFFVGSNFELVIDGFSNGPTTFENILLVFEPDPGECATSITVDGSSVANNVYPIGDLEVNTPTPYGNNYSDTVTHYVTWLGCYGVRMWAFADENYNGVRDGGECFTAFSHDSTVPVETASWGVIKNLYQD
jgi:hypothetical protein